ncbi:peptide-methionine (S)-S-oxide reductase MsrA [Halocola ammonii]
MSNHKFFNFAFLMMLVLSSCSAQDRSSSDSNEYIEPNELSDAQKEQLESAVFAGGCFWCTEAVFERVEGVVKVVSGYSGGDESTADYSMVSSGKTDHAEAIEIFYDPDKIDYRTLVKAFLGGHDPTQLNRQGPDVGTQYRSAIFYRTEEEKKIAQEVISEFEEKGVYSDEIVTKLTPFDGFYLAEDYHQNYYRLNPNNSYIRSVSKPKVEKFMKNYPELLKEEYRKK